MNNLEEKILDAVKWQERDYNGNLVHNIISNDDKNIADIVCARRNDFIEIKWISSNSEPISLHYSKKDNIIVQEKSDPSLTDEQSIDLYLDGIKKLVNYNFNKFSFFPTDKIQTNKIKIK